MVGLVPRPTLLFINRIHVRWVEERGPPEPGCAMPNYKRNYVPGGTYFFTVVTHERRPFFTTEIARTCLRDAIAKQQAKRPFEMVAVVLLPDHLHTIWTLPPGDDDFSIRWAGIKEAFSREYLKNGGLEGSLSNSRKKHRERAIWQRRFWEHTCRDEDDLKRFLDYLHWNPCKHGLAKNVKDYAYSTFQQFVKLGEYDENWGTNDPCPDFDDPEWE
jgi:putative transposase